MPAYSNPVPIVALVVGYLAEQDDLDGVPVSSRLPRSWQAGDRAVRVARVGGTSSDRAGWLVNAVIQFECYGETEADAEVLAGIVGRLVLELGDVGTRPEGVVTGTAETLGATSSPDPETDAPRWLFSRIVRAHPSPE